MKQNLYTKKETMTGVLIIALTTLIAAGLFCGQSALLFAICLIVSITLGTYFLVELFLPETRAYPYRKLITSAVPAISYIIMFFTSGVADSYLSDNQDQMGTIYKIGDYYAMAEDYASSLDGYALFASLCCIVAFTILLADIGMFFTIRDKQRAASQPKTPEDNEVEVVDLEQKAEPATAEPAETPAEEAAPAEKPAEEKPEEQAADLDITDVD